MCKKETENELPNDLPVQHSISNAICFFCDSAGVFSKQDFVVTKIYKKHLLHRVELFNLDDDVRQSVTQMGDTKLSANLLLAREACYHEH